jgi:hypothetical protein
MHALIGDRVIIAGYEPPAALQGMLAQGWRGVAARRHAARQSHLPTLRSASACDRQVYAAASARLPKTSSRSDKVTHATRSVSAAILIHD